MNETDLNVSSKFKSICVTCLKTTNDLSPMSFEYKTEYKKFVKKTEFKMANEHPEMICSECCWQFHRFLKFKHQCQMARTLLKDAVNLNLKSDFSFQKLTHCQNLVTTNPELHYFSKFHENTLHDVQSIQITQSQSSNFNEHGTQILKPQMNGLKVNQIQDDGFDSTEFNNDDEVPLVMLSKSDGSKKRKEKVIVVQTTAEIKSEIEEESGKKVKKKLKEGFSSRMVQETDEYIVIKLNKDQVLQEMKDRSRSEAYVQSPYKCEQCIKGFNFQDVLSTHMEKHTEEMGSFQCDMCSQYCRSAVSLRGHIKSHTTRYKCKLCGVVRLSRQHLLEHHAITHTRQAVTYSCDSCQFNTNKRTVMQRHVKSHAKSEPHACEQCGKLFRSIDSLRVHTMRHDKSSRLRCTQCDVSFVYHSLLRRHITRVHERRDYYCVECDAQFKSNESLRLHFKKAKKHRDSSSYKHACAQCALSFWSASALATHGATAHGAIRAHACSLCRRRYSSADALRAHAWRVHATKHTVKPS